MRLVFALIAACAQVLADGPVCYIDPVFTDDQLVITKNIYFGENINKETKENQKLYLDAYMPPTSDTRTKRPVVVFIHGGGFTDGTRGWS